MAMSPYLGSGTRPRSSAVIGLVIATAVLYLAKEVLVPLALAILLTFVFAPAVRRLERGLWRIPATLIVVFVGFSLIGAVLWIAGDQAVSLAARLPEYRENIIQKIHAVRAPRSGDLGKAAEAIKDLQSEAAPEQPPLPVTQKPGSPIEALIEFVAPFAKPVGTALAVIVFTILMLLNRENMVERLIAVIGPDRINLMTRAMGEVSYRVARYLYMQLVVNACFGIPFGIALYFIGIPNAMLWGLLGMVLRFIPYAGVWIAAAMPALLAFAISDDWSMVGWTLGVFVALELVLVNGVEPWLYGRSAGLAPIAIILAAIFWTWLWGPIGLLLATPLTVCVTVMGRYIPELGFLNVLLGVEPVLSPEERFYQRLVALDLEEALELAEKHTEAHGVLSTFDSVIIPALSLAEIDRHKEALEPARERFIFDSMRRIVEELESSAETAAASAQNAHDAAGVCIVAAHDDADQIAGLMLARLLPAGQFKVSLVDPQPDLNELVHTVEKNHCKVLCISAVPPHAINHAGYIARRLRKRLPNVKILVGLWTAEGDIGKSRERLLQLGVDQVVPRLADAVEEIRQLAA
jgi:predicted PurR-regulated permease PerM